MNKIGQFKVFLMVGYPGSGKSTLARKMAEFFQAFHLSSDDVREKLFNSSRYDSIGDEIVSLHRDKVYELMGEMILDNLKNNKKVILDATNIETLKREKVLEVLLKKLSKKQICFVCVKTPQQVIKNWLALLDENSSSEEESLLEGWQRVYAIFKQKKKEGLISWPKYKDIRVISAKTMYAYLDQAT